MKIVIDCDAGNDDAWAIISLLRAEHKSNYKVLGITCVNGNTKVEHSSLNTLLVLKTLDRLDVPVFEGATESLIRNKQHYEPFHGADGFGMVYTPEEKPSKDLVQKKHAVQALKDFIDEVCKIFVSKSSKTNYFLIRIPMTSQSSPSGH